MSFLRSIPRILASGSNILWRSVAGSATTFRPLNHPIPEFAFIEEPLGLPASTGFGYVDLKLGQRIGPTQSLEILRKLGWGSNASVWLAKDHDTREYVAIKVLTS